MIDAERLDLESASSAYRRRRCIGSVNLVRELRTAGKLSEQPPSVDAASGTAVHRAWCGIDGSLSERETQTLASLRRMEAMLVTDWAGNDEYSLLGREQRLWMHQGLDPVHSGQFDVAYGTLVTHRMLILDGKTLFGEVSPAETNDQMRELVALAHLNYPAAREFSVAILQPWVSARPSVALYDHAEAELALRMLRQTIADSADPDAPRTPGFWCHYCPAIHQCEEARAFVGKTYRLAKRIEAGEFALPLGERGAAFLDSVKAAETILSALKNAYREIVTNDPGAIPGWYMKPGKKVREIPEVARAVNIASELGVDLAQIYAATKLSITKLQTSVGKTLSLKGETLEREFAKLFASVITYKENAPELVRESVATGRKRELSNTQANHD